MVREIATFQQDLVLFENDILAATGKDHFPHLHAYIQEVDDDDDDQRIFKNLFPMSEKSLNSALSHFWQLTQMKLKSCNSDIQLVNCFSDKQEVLLFWKNPFIFKVDGLSINQ